MYLLIRNGRGEAVGIMSNVERSAYAGGNCPAETCVCLREHLSCAIRRNLALANWSAEEINRSQFETYRDLHEFKVIKL